MSRIYDHAKCVAGLFRWVVRPGAWSEWLCTNCAGLLRHHVGGAPMQPSDDHLDPDAVATSPEDGDPLQFAAVGRSGIDSIWHQIFPDTISDFPRLEHLVDTQYKYVVTIDGIDVYKRK